MVCAMGRASQGGVGRVGVGPVAVPGGSVVSIASLEKVGNTLYMFAEADFGEPGAARFLARWPGPWS